MLLFIPLRNCPYAEKTTPQLRKDWTFPTLFSAKTLISRLAVVRACPEKRSEWTKYKHPTEGPVHRQELFIPHTPFLYKTWYSRRIFTLFLLSKRFVVHTSKVLYPQFLYEIPFYVRGKNKQIITNETPHRFAGVV